MNEHPPRDVLSALVDGECAPEERRWAYEHIGGCNECRRTVAEFTSVRGLLGDLPSLVAPQDFVNRVLAPRRTWAPLRGRRRYVAAAAASVAVVVSLAGLAAPPESEEPPVDVFLTRHVGTQDASRVGGQVLFAVHGR
jgi:anti-sigma factor RsiW